MIDRTVALETLIASADANTCFVSCLGRTSRDLFAITTDIRERCLYNMGAMGSVLPITLGLALAQEATPFIAIEGDGSILMNLGSLATLKRYGKGNIQLVIMDNKVYESTGGQVSQPDNFHLENVCTAIGLRTITANTTKDIDRYFSLPVDSGSPSVLVIKTKMKEPHDRISDSPKEIAERFMNHLTVNA